ncbi:amidohydrolase family protein [Mesorhizobium sp. M7A.F.Ca.MR.362.00.0.0]|uniref:N-acyl-D-amino-acid deacylase family protein n=1 Tax=Mesorhizobium sp. M7A.F.Ca.MR.362.00.0.0 TaxID=2496779 RepID=UPI000FD3C218|nr:D-aminoacylase [Mesorhizobium sp. M7A.F.Ca.MR.362.00.0.0]RUU83020.1 D-aminoacylase [Mesorhizobium sp. M7A.F.Ca.MR.362.00.0.0]RWN92314.1 MAG: D-aminoacylase [Mesorhizobium sp.]
MPYDLVIRHATLIAGDGAKPFEADIAVTGDRITAIGRLDDATGSEEIDARGKVVAPGFIDVHTHDDGALLAPRGMDPKISQGVTTVIAGNCGVSLAPLLLDRTPPPPFTLVGGRESFRFARFADYVAELKKRGIATNAALLVGHTTLRQRCMPVTDRPANEAETAAMQEAVERAMAEGAFGLSTGLDYPPAVNSSTEEVKALAATAASLGGPYVTHTRNYFETMEEAIEEAIDIADHAGGKLFISHHQCTGHANFGKSRPSLERIDQARETMDIGMDVYPYAASSTVLRLERCDTGLKILVTWSDPHPELARREIADIAREWNCSEREAGQRLLPAGAVYFHLDETDVRNIIAHPRTMIGSDGLPHDIHPHPRLWGTFPRVLGHYARDIGLFSLEEAVFRMTGLPAREFGIQQRGLLAEGNFADLVIFDPETIIDTATFEQPRRPAAGIEQVLVNGVSVWRGGRATGALPGMVLKPSASKTVVRGACGCGADHRAS